MSHVFISYASADYRDAVALSAFLEGRGVKTWIAPRDIPAGKPHTTIVPDAIAGSSALVLIVTEAANGARYVPGEIQIAVDADKPVVPVRLSDTAVTGQLRYLLGQFQWIDAFRQPTDVWRNALLATLHGDQAPRSRAPPREISLSPVLLAAGAFAFLWAVVVSIVSVGEDTSIFACSSGAEFGCWLTRNRLAAGAMATLAAAALAPSFLGTRFRPRRAELRDAVAVAIAAGFVLLGSLFYFFSWFLLGVVGAVAYFSLLRPWLDASRTAIAGVALTGFALAATAAEGGVLEAWRRSNPSVLALSRSERDHVEGSAAERTAFDFFRKSRKALELMTLPITPAYAKPETLTPAEFRALRVVKPSDLRNRFAQAIVEWRPFSLVFTADTVPPMPRCGRERWATLSVRVEDYQLGEPPLWTWGEPRRPATLALAALPFEFEMFAKATAGGDIEDPTLVMALVAANLADWMGSRSQGMLSEERLADIRLQATKMLRTALVDTGACAEPGAGVPSQALCSMLVQGATTSVAVRKAATEFSARSEPDETGTPFYGPACAAEVRRQARLVARLDVPSAP